MMQMLQQGGMNLFTDGVRQPDESNPRGYFEHEAVKALMRNREFIQDAEGKVVKVIAQLLDQLPARFAYKVIFMERELNEVLQSQHKMLLRQGKAKEEAMPLRLVDAFQQNLQKVKVWLPKQKNMEVLYVNHPDIIADPAGQSERIKRFLGVSLDIEAMASVVDPSLHRQKTPVK